MKSAFTVRNTKNDGMLAKAFRTSLRDLVLKRTGTSTTGISIMYTISIIGLDNSIAKSGSKIR